MTRTVIVATAMTIQTGHSMKRGPSGLQPKSLCQAITDPLWKTSLLNEMRGIIQNGSFEVAELPTDKKTLSVLQFFMTKLNLEDSTPKYQTGIVARGYQQRKGVDYELKFALLARHNSLRLVLALTAQFNGEFQYYDVKQAYLNGPLDKDIYVSLPKILNEIVEDETKTSNPNRMYRLKKALYDPKQAGRLWNDLAADMLQKCGYVQCFYENYLFVMRRNESVSIILIYVDDIFELSIGEPHSEELLEALKIAAIVVQPLGFPSNFIEFQIIRDANHLFVNQSSYIEKNIEKFGLADEKAQRAPPQTKLI